MLFGNYLRIQIYVSGLYVFLKINPKLVTYLFVMVNRKWQEHTTRITPEPYNKNYKTAVIFIDFMEYLFILKLWSRRDWR